MMRVLVVAKAPVAGLAKTRLGVRIGHAAAAPRRRRGAARHPRRLPPRPSARRAATSRSPATCDAGRTATSSRALLAGWTVIHAAWRRPRRAARARPRRRRAVRAASCRSAWTPRRSRRTLLRDAAAGSDEHDAVLGPADDGGWWVLALPRPGAAAGLAARADVDRRRRTPTPAPRWPAPGLTVAAGPRPPRRRHRRGRGAVAPAAPGHGVRAAPGSGEATDDAASCHASVFSPALQGQPCAVVGLGRDEPVELPVAGGPRAGRPGRPSMLALCVGPTLDIGCGPGPDDRGAGRARPRRRSASTSCPRPSARRGAAGCPRCGATSSTRCPARAAGAPRCWPTATSASAATRSPCCARVRELLDPRGRVVVERRPPGTRHRAPAGRRLGLRRVAQRAVPRGRSSALDAIGRVAASAGLGVVVAPRARRPLVRRRSRRRL